VKGGASPRVGVASGCVPGILERGHESLVRNERSQKKKMGHQEQNIPYPHGKPLTGYRMYTRQGKKKIIKRKKRITKMIAQAYEGGRPARSLSGRLAAKKKSARGQGGRLASLLKISSKKKKT